MSPSQQCAQHTAVS